MSVHNQVVKIVDAETPAIAATVNQRGSVGAQSVEIVDASGNQITSFPAGLSIPEHDDIVLGYDDDDNLISVIYKMSGTTVATLALTYSGSVLTRIQKI